MLGGIANDGALPTMALPPDEYAAETAVEKVHAAIEVARADEWAELGRVGLLGAALFVRRLENGSEICLRMQERAQQRVTCIRAS